MTGDFFVSLSKFKGKIQTFSLFNMRFVAIVPVEDDLIKIYSVFEKDEEVFRLKLQMEYLQEYLLEAKEREKHFIEREKEIF